MFGDLFSQRGDYTQGLLYAGRRTFLRSDPVEPPQEFKTKRQAKRSITSERESMNQKVGQKIDGQKPDAFNLVFENLRKDGKGALQKAAKNSLDKRLVIEKFSTTDKEAWKEKNLAGCKLWVNESTGEVSQECPWLPLSTAETSSATIRDNTQPKKNNEKEFGTGSLVYEDKELNDLLVMLDASQAKPKK